MTKGGIYWLASYPKSGNTWFRVVLTNFQKNENRPIDINQISTGAIASSRLWIDDVMGIDTADLSQEEIEALRPELYRWSLQEAPDLIGYHKIHDAYSARNDGRPLVDNEATRGAVYILRNPLDVVPSLANHNGVDLDTAITQMADPDHALSRSTNRLSSQLLQRLGTWSRHVESWVDARGIKLHVLRYEDMQADPLATFGEAFDFLELPDDRARLARAIEFSRFDVLSAQEEKSGFRERAPKSARFFRTGRVGDWRNHLTPMQAKRVIADHYQVMHRFGYLDNNDEPIF